MKIPLGSLAPKILWLAAGLLVARSAFAASATWKLRPGSIDWNTPSNWTPATVPNDVSDIATFGVSHTTDIACSSQVVLDRINFEAGASPFTITAPPTEAILFYGAGIVNSSGILQTFIVPGDDFLLFSNNATAGTSTNYIAKGDDSPGYIIFDTAASAGQGSFTVEGGIYAYTVGGEIDFRDSAIPADANFTVDGGTVENAYGGTFFDSSSVGAELTGSYVANGGAAKGATGGTLSFSTASALTFNGSFTANGGSAVGAYGALMQINTGLGTSGHGSFTVNGGNASGAYGAYVGFSLHAPAQATYTVNGGQAGGAFGGILDFIGLTNIGGRINAYGGANGGAGGAVRFTSGGGAAMADANPAASIGLFGNASFDESVWFDGSHAVGSIEGSGLIFLGQYPLIVGSDNRSTSFSGVIQDGGLAGGEGGSLTKVGNGTLTLSGANTYTGGTVVNSGRLLVSGKSGFATGTGSIQVNGGIFGGVGMVSGPITVGAAAQPASLAPGSDKKTGRMITGKTVAFGPMAVFQLTLNTGRAGIDQLVAQGVTISQGATISFTDLGGTVLPAGTVFTAISNTAASAISGAFANLPSGSIVTVGANKFQASYAGGDGNDLTLTVVP